MRANIKHISLDTVIAIVTSCIGAALIINSVIFRQLSDIGVVIFISPLLYLLFRRRILQGHHLPSFQVTSRVKFVNRTIFILSLCAGIWLLWSNLYYRPPIYFAVSLVAAASIIGEIFYFDDKKGSPFIILSQIILLGILIYAGIYYQFPGIYGADPWWNSGIIQEMVATGHIPTTDLFRASPNPYYLFPLFHILGGETQILTSLGSYHSIFISTGFLMGISSIFVFLIGRKLVNVKAGLLAALILCLSDYVIQRATAIIAMSLGFCFAAAILYLILCREKRAVANMLVIILLSASLILTHTIAAVVTFIALAAVFVGIKVYEAIQKQDLRPGIATVSLGLVALFGISMLTRWMQAPTEGAEGFFYSVLCSVRSALTIDLQFLPTVAMPEGYIPYSASVINSGGYTLLIAFAIIGSLICLQSSNRTRGRLSLISVIVALMIWVYGSYLFALTKPIVVGRWYIFMYVPLAILGSLGLISLTNVIKSNAGRLAAIMVVILATLFLMTTNSTANDDSPWLFNGAFRGGYTQSELTAIESLSHMSVGRPKTDDYYGGIFPHIIGYDAYTDMVSRDNSIFIVRRYCLRHPEYNEKYMIEIHEGGFGLPRKEKVLLSDYMKELGIDKKPLIYNNGNVRAYVLK